MSTSNDNKPERRHIDNIPQGTRVVCNGYNGAIVRQYDGDTYEIRLPSGVVATDDFELDYTQPQPPQGEQPIWRDNVARVSGFAGVPAETEQAQADLQTAVDYIDELKRERDALQAQRDELLAALKACLPPLRRNFGRLGIEEGKLFTSALRTADAAIARATGGTGQ